MGVKPEMLSPYHHVRAGQPPTIIFHGREDPLIPFAKIEAEKPQRKSAPSAVAVMARASP